jgi:hypothetical protein
MRICFLSAGGTIMVVCCEHGFTVQAVSWMHVTPLVIVNVRRLDEMLKC